MDESQIAAQVAKNIPREAPVEPTPVVDEVPQPSAFETNVELNDPAIGMELADYFEVSKVDRFTEEAQRDLRSLYRWAAERAGSADKASVLQQLRVLEMELGLVYKPGRLQKLARWVSLDKQAEALRVEKEMLRG